MTRVVPVFRVFDLSRAIEFYFDWLGFEKEWEHAPAGAPFYMRVSIRGVSIDLSEHHGECSPGARLTIENFQGLEEYHRQLTSKDYKYMKPGLERVEWAPD